MNNVIPFPNPDEIAGAQAPVNPFDLDMVHDSAIIDLWHEACSMTYVDCEVTLGGNGHPAYTVKETIRALFPKLEPLTDAEIIHYLINTGRESWITEGE